MQNRGASDNQLPLLDQKPPVSHIYKIKRETLQQLFQVKEGQQVFQDDLVEDLGKATGILKDLASERNTGIVGDEKDLKRRKKVFGENLRPKPPQASIQESFLQTVKNLMWLIIGVTAFLSSIVSLFTEGWTAALEGISIIIISIILIILMVFTDYFKDKKYIELSSKIKEETVPVIRGKLGATQSISIWDVVVGDVVLLETGASVPADCLIIEAQDLQIDEPDSLQDGDDQGQLLATNKDVNKNEKDPTLLAGSLIKRGQCRAVVCAVGEYSSRGVVDKKLDTEKDTALQQKLKNLEAQFMKFAAYACLIILILLGIMLVVKFAGDEPWYTVLFNDSLKMANLIVVIFIVVVPEGLPLTIGVSLAYTTGTMYDEDKILVKELDAPEKMGEVNEILVGKTSTITGGNMKMSQFLCEDKQIKNTRKNTLLHCELSDITLELIKESILFNCSARIEMDATTYVPVGNATEVGLLKFLQDADIPVHLLIQQKLGKVKIVSPFNSIRKRSATVVSNPNRPGTVTIYLKGAPEVILDMCQSIQSSNGIVQLTPDLAEEIRREVDQMAAKPLRVISFAYWEMDEEQWKMQFDQTGKEFEQALDDRNIQFTFLGAFGLKDPLRKNVKSVVNAIKQKDYVNVRMISGDHFETARRVAHQAGIITEDDLRKQHSVMDADEFRNMVGILEQSQVDGPNGPETKLNLEKEENFVTILDDVKVLSRANSDDKLLMVIGLKNAGKIVAVTGDGINDIEAIEAADVGIAMGTGCSAAKLSSQLILTDDDFESCIRAVMWGRNIYHNVGRFLQFQVTVNISVLLVTVIGICLFGQSPLSPTQLLWINLIMDTFAAIALSTEPPMEKILKQPPTSNASILTAPIWRQIIGLSIWNAGIIVVLYLFGTVIGGLYGFNFYTAKTSEPRPATADCDSVIIGGNYTDYQGQQIHTDCDSYWQGQSKLRLFTYVYCTFVFLQLFNYLNCRKIGQNEVNVFERILGKFNPYFWMIILGVILFQIFQVQYLHNLTRTTHLTRSEWGACIVAGSTVLLISALLKLLGYRILKYIPVSKFIDEDNQQTNDNRLIQSMNKYNNMEVNINTDMLKNRGKKGKKQAETAEAGMSGDDNYQQQY